MEAVALDVVTVEAVTMDVAVTVASRSHHGCNGNVHLHGWKFPRSLAKVRKDREDVGKDSLGKKFIGCIFVFDTLKS